ncbi:Putative structural protein [Cellulophaga phage phi14:2]|uniref:Structural protein n=1 Tax=Cellulophaga phage phi14:2 TaxID=1327990 RepID=S0A3H3_9CAUD|nr:Putative structural protein [Cellulophaga phage phi14:2]AGO48977.1 structural protein [Cellulophaga phage phi14:2]
MSAFGPQNSGDLLVGSTYGTSANALAFITSANDKAIQVFSGDDTALAVNKPFKLLQKASSAKAGFEFSEIIDPKSINYVKFDSYSAPVQRVLRVEGFTGTPRANVTYEVFIRLYNDGGTLSVENFRMIPAFYTTPSDVTGLTFATILTSLKSDLDKTLAKEGSSLFTTSIDTTNGYFIVQGNNKSFVLGKKDGKPVEFELQAAVRDNGSATTLSGARYSDLTVATATAGSSGVGTGVQAANLEWFYKGYKYSRYREVDSVNGFPGIYQVDSSKTYHVGVISYYKERSYTNVEKQHRLLYILIDAADQDGAGAGTSFTAVNALIADLETVTGLTIADLS